MAATTAEALAEARAMEGPLSAKLAHYAVQMRALAGPVAVAYDRLVARVTAGEVGIYAPTVGQQLASFLLPSDDGHLIHSADLLARAPTIISFNRGHWCPFCRLEVGALAGAAADVDRLGGQILSITPEPAALNKRLRADTGAPFTFLSDLDNAYALELGLVMRVDDQLRDLFVARGLDLAKFHANDHRLLPVPATFVVGRDGIIHGRFIDPDFRRRAAIDDILAALPR